VLNDLWQDQIRSTAGPMVPTVWGNNNNNNNNSSVASASEHSSTSSEKRILKRIQRSSDSLHAHMNILGKRFPICGPRVQVVGGHRLWALGKRKPARKQWNEGLVQALKFSMPLDQARLHVELGRHPAQPLSIPMRAVLPILPSFKGYQQISRSASPSPEPLQKRSPSPPPILPFTLPPTASSELDAGAHLSKAHAILSEQGAALFLRQYFGDKKGRRVSIVLPEPA